MSLAWKAAMELHPVAVAVGFPTIRISPNFLNALFAVFIYHKAINSQTEQPERWRSLWDQEVQ